ncbi:hypothetical protein O3669_06425 [Pauljensenia sp. 20925_1_34]|uniref:hypothetical protein n=1 Tax=Pauljensenia sp. 20925_1_34 TaxID=3003674 RepID=UPI00352DAF6D
MASDKSPSEDPRLVFNLPGTWFPVAITDEGASEQDVERMVQGIVGPADDAAVLRRQMHDQVVDACAAAAEGGAVAMYFGKELEKDAPFPVNITVYQPPGLRMSPAIGTESDEVFGILRMGFDDADDTFVDVEGGNYRALRRLLIEKDDSFQIEVPEEETPEEAALRAEAEKLQFERMRVDYWAHVPDTKQIVIVSFVTQMAMIKNLMLELFDLLIAASYFVSGSADEVESESEATAETTSEATNEPEEATAD